MGKKIETIGSITKEETISLLGHDVMKNTFVIDIDHPFPGYYGGKMMDKDHPKYIILITKRRYPWEKILRATSNINKYLDLNLCGAFVEINIGNREYSGIRLKGLPDYEIIPKVENAYREEGFDLMKKKRIEENAVSIFKVKKFFEIEEISEGFYKDVAAENMYYFEIPNYLNWELFRSITMQVKNNVSDKIFDAVEGLFLMKCGVIDVVRIYKPNMTLKVLKEIREKYMERITKFEVLE